MKALPFLLFFCFLISCGPSTKTAGPPVQKLIIAVVADQPESLTADSRAAQSITSRIMDDIKRAGHTVRQHSSAHHSAGMTLQDILKAYQFQKQDDYLIVLRIKANVRQVGRRKAVKTSVRGALIDLKSENISKRLTSPEQQTLIPTNCLASCVSDRLTTTLPQSAQTISTQIVAKIGDRSPIIQKETARTLEAMGKESDQLIKDGKIAANEAVFLSLQYNIELRGLDGALLKKIEQRLKRLEGYTGHVVAFRTPEKKRYILHYKSTLKMADLRVLINQSIEDLGYSAKTYIYARTFQVYISEKDFNKE